MSTSIVMNKSNTRPLQAWEINAEWDCLCGVCGVDLEAECSGACDGKESKCVCSDCGDKEEDYSKCLAGECDEEYCKHENCEECGILMGGKCFHDEEEYDEHEDREDGYNADGDWFCKKHRKEQVYCDDCKGQMDIDGHRTYHMPCGATLCKACMEDKHCECNVCFDEEYECTECNNSFNTELNEHGDNVLCDECNVEYMRKNAKECMKEGCDLCETYLEDEEEIETQ